MSKLSAQKRVTMCSKALVVYKSCFQRYASIMVRFPERVPDPTRWMLSIKTVWWLQHIVRQFQSTHPFSWQDIVVWRSYIVVHHRVQSHIQNSLLGLLVFNRVRWWHEIDKGPIYSFWGKADSQHRGSKIVCAAHVKPLFAEHSRSRCWSKTHVLFCSWSSPRKNWNLHLFILFSTISVFYHPFRLRYNSPPARWGLLDFMSVASSSSSSSFSSFSSSSASSPPPPRRPRRPRRPCSTATRDPQCSLPDLNHDHPRPVFPAGPQPRPSAPSVPCRTSTTTIRAQCSLPDLNRDHPRPVFPAGPQPRPSAPSVPCRTSTASIHAKCSLPDLM